MRVLLPITLMLSAISAPAVENWMEHAYYPALLLVLVLASLGLPIPEDIPLIASGVLLKTHLGPAHWAPTLGVALLGIMSGDVILYLLGKHWGPSVVSHRSVSWIITPERFLLTRQRFRHYGNWMCFFGRFVMGIRAVMCLTAGATHFPFWRFFLADFAGALLSVPLFVWLGYWFAGMIPALRSYVSGIEGGLLTAGAVAVAAFIFYEYRKLRRAHQHEAVRAAPTPLDAPALPEALQADESSAASDSAATEIVLPPPSTAIRKERIELARAKGGQSPRREKPASRPAFNAGRTPSP